MISETSDRAAPPPAVPPRQRPAAIPRKHPIPHHVARFVLRPIFRVCFRMRSEGLDQLPAQGPYLLAPNHVSMLDWAFISYFLPKLTRFVVDRLYYEQPLLGLGLRVNGAIPVRTQRPDPRAMRVLHSVLAAGEPMIFFPEGRISLDGRPKKGQPGLISLAAATRTPVVPVAIRGAFESFPRWRKLPRPGRVTVVFGRTLASPPAAATRDEQHLLADRLMDHIAALLDGEAAPPPPW